MLKIPMRNVGSILLLLILIVALGLVAAIMLLARQPPDLVDGIDGLPLELFPQDYVSARSRFRAACAETLKAHGGECRSFPIDSAKETDLTIDTAYITAGNRRLLMVQSGIHGVEAYAGSAVQARLMEYHLERLLERGFDVLLVHAMNPYGFQHNLRTDEANVNLNRNFSTDPSLFKSENRAYEKLRWIFEPRGTVGNVTLDSLRTKLRLLWAYAAAGFDGRQINEAMNTGQYRFAEGLGYGGTGPRPQVGFLETQVAPILATYSGDILYLDVHTGLGEAGVLHVITGNRTAAGLLSRLKSMIETLRGAGIALTTAADPGFYPTTGDVIDFVPGLAKDPDHILAVTIEYGTVGAGTLDQLTTASRMVLQNQALTYGCVSVSACNAVQSEFRELFNPTDQQWRARVLRQTDALFVAIASDF